MAADIEKTLGINASLERGSSGVFEILLDGVPVFSKRGTGRFPLPGEVEAALKSRLRA